MFQAPLKTDPKYRNLFRQSEIVLDHQALSNRIRITKAAGVSEKGGEGPRPSQTGCLHGSAPSPGPFSPQCDYRQERPDAGSPPDRGARTFAKMSGRLRRESDVERQ